jgi:MOSC domain-containing protein YiiM
LCSPQSARSSLPTMANVHQISISNGGVPKLPVASAIIDERGVVGDNQADTVHHGNPDQALCLFSLEVIEGFQAEGHPISPGSAGENLTIEGLDWNQMVPGTVCRIGDTVQIEVTSYTRPCAKNEQWFVNGEFTRMLQTRHPGESRVYARVMDGGPIDTGDEVRLDG